MGVETTYRCDKCGHSQPNDGQMWAIGIFVESGRYSYQYAASRTPRKEALWCRTCVEKLGLLPPTPPAVKPDPQPTLEDMIRAIIREEMPQ